MPHPRSSERPNAHENPDRNAPRTGGAAKRIHAPRWCAKAGRRLCQRRLFCYKYLIQRQKTTLAHDLLYRAGIRNFATLKSFYLTYRYGNATSADFIKTAVKVSGKPRVRDLLQHWLYHETVPALPGAASATALQAGAAEAPPKSGAAVRRH